MRDGQLNNLNVLTQIRQELRNGATEAEVTLWQHLKGRQLAGRKFRRQHSIGLFVLDFYCPSDRLAIEVDGAVHHTPDAIAHDEERQKAIETLAITVLRFSNDDVLHRINQVVSRIHAYFGEEPPARAAPPNPLLKQEGVKKRVPRWVAPSWLTEGVGGGSSVAGGPSITTSSPSRRALLRVTRFGLPAGSL